jgi:multidrug resistance efflux pump
MSKRLPQILFLLLPLCAVLGMVLYLRSRPKTVETVTPRLQTVVESLAVSGRVRGDVETAVGAQTGGVVRRVLVREGDIVSSGQIVARLDDTVLTGQTAQAEEAITTAEAQRAQAADAVSTACALLSQASRPPLPSDVARLKVDTRQAASVAQARLSAARQRLRELEAGPTREEREQAEAQARQARASAAQAKRDWERQRALLAEGAVAKAVVDSAETAAEVAQRAEENAGARLRQLNAGTRPELLAQARADVRAAEATLAGVKASGKEQLSSLLGSARPEEIQVAKARLREAEQALRVADARERKRGGLWMWRGVAGPIRLCAPRSAEP